MNVDNRVSAGEPSVLRSISRHRVLIAVVTVAVGLLGLLVYSLRSTTYVAEAGVLLEDPRSAYLLSESSKRDEDRYVADQVSILKSPALLGRASQLIAAGDPAAISIRELQRSTSIRTTEGSNYIVIRYAAEDPTTSMLGANAIVDAYRELVRADLEATTAAAIKRLNVAIADVTQALATSERADPANSLLLQQLRSRRSELEVDVKLAGDGVALLSPAELGRREGPSLTTALLLAVVLGGLMGVGLAYVLDLREMRLSRPIGSRIRMRVPLLAEVPDFSEEGLSSKLPALDAPGTRLADTFRFLAVAVGLRRDPLDGSVSAKLAESLQDEIPGMTDRELAVLDQVASRLDRIAQESERPASRKGKTKSKRDLMVRSVAFVAASPGDGTTTVAANTALAAAQAGDRVLMLDGDLWGRGLTQLLLDGNASPSANGNRRRVGLTDMLLRGPLPEGINLVTETSTGGTLSVIEPGATTLEAMNAIRTDLIRPGLDATREDFDRVFIDVPPILQLPYANALVTSCDAVVVVSNHGGDPASLERLVDVLDQLEVRPIGQVLNFAPVAHGTSRDLTSDVRAGAERLASYVSFPPRLRARTESKGTSRATGGHGGAAEEPLGELSAGQERI